MGAHVYEMLALKRKKNEDTSGLVLGLADRLNIDVQPEDIEVSHRVCPLRRRSTVPTI